MGRRPISFGHISPRSTSQERRNLILGLFTERGASHLRARCARCDHTSASCSRPLRRPSTAPPSPTSWLGANIASLLLLSASLGCGLKMPFSSTSFCSILCIAVPFFPPAAGKLRTAADASTPRGSASCADPRGVILSVLKAPCFKELYVLRHECSLQLHLSCAQKASCYSYCATAHCAACSCSILLLAQRAVMATGKSQS